MLSPVLTLVLTPVLSFLSSDPVSTCICILVTYSSVLQSSVNNCRLLSGFGNKGRGKNGLGNNGLGENGRTYTTFISYV